MAPKVDPKLLRDEYVTSSPKVSARELARRYGLSNATVSARVRAEGWDDLRAAYQESVARRTYERVADSEAVKEAAIAEESILVMRATLRQYATQLRDGRVTVTTKDAVDAVKTLLLLTGEPTSRSENKVELNSGGVALDDLRRLVELARARIVDGTVGADTLALPEGTG